MTFKAITAFHDSNLYNAIELDQSLKCAIEFANEIGAHLKIVILGMMPLPSGAAGYSAGGLGIWYDDTGNLADEFASKVASIKSWIDAEKLPTSFSYDICDKYGHVGLIRKSVSNFARYADLSIISHPVDVNQEKAQQMINGALFDTGRPLLLMNNQKVNPQSLNKVLLAWDAGIRASKSVHHALPLLKVAKDVQIIVVDPDELTDYVGEKPGVELENFLKLHGVATSTHYIASESGTTSERLKAMADKIDADLIVMGAYGHSKLQEFLWGGSTKKMLEVKDRALFLAH